MKIIILRIKRGKAFPHASKPAAFSLPPFYGGYAPVTPL
jgi:hypothetical protein